MYFFFADEVADDARIPVAGCISHTILTGSNGADASEFTRDALFHRQDRSLETQSLPSRRRNVTPLSPSLLQPSKPGLELNSATTMTRLEDPKQASFCIDLFTRFPTEVIFRVFAFLDTRSLVAARATPRFAEVIRNLYASNRTHLCALAVRLQYPIEHSHPVLRYLTEASEGSPQLLRLAPNERDEDYRACLEMINGCTDLATMAIQLSMPLMQQRPLIKKMMLYMFGLLPHFEGVRYELPRSMERSGCFWAMFAKFTSDERHAVINLLDNMWHAFLVANPINFQSRIALCQHNSGVKCAWAITERLTDELTALGIFEIIAKQRILAVLAAMFYSYMSLNHVFPPPGYQAELAEILGMFQQQVWDPHVVHCAATHGLGARRFRAELRLASDVDYIISIFGERGSGTIELQLDPSYDILRWLIVGMSTGSGHTPSWEDIPADGRGMLAGAIDRDVYWDLWDYDENFCLEELFRDAPARRVTVDDLEARLYRLSLE